MLKTHSLAWSILSISYISRAGNLQFITKIQQRYFSLVNYKVKHDLGFLHIIVYLSSGGNQ